jgi:ribosomal protein L19
MENIKSVLLPKPLFTKPLPGSVLDLTYEDQSGRWRVRKFSGVCISFSHKVEYRSILRNVFNGLAVELSFPLSSPSVLSAQRSTQYKLFKLRRSKLFYLRKKRLSESKVK